MWRLPYVRFEGDAKSRPFAGGLRAAGWLASGAIGTLAIACLMPLPQFSAGTLVMHALTAAALVAVGTALAAAAYCRQRIGGYTGDCLGAVQQLSELGFLLTGLAVLNPIKHVA
jgi:adenosylcobinamide-GDP ribazoletransferase